MIASGQSKTSGQSTRERLTSRSSKSCSLTRRRRWMLKALEAGGACKKIGPADPATSDRNLGGLEIVENDFEAGDRHRRFADVPLATASRGGAGRGAKAARADAADGH